jgi:hypothetical protein
MKELTDVDHHNALGKLQTKLKTLIASKAPQSQIATLQTVIKVHKKIHKPPRYYYDMTTTVKKK